MTPSAAPVRCGRISFTNDLPVYAAFDLGERTFPGVLRSGVPTELNRALLAGELDLSPVSSFFYAQHSRELALQPAFCIGSRKEVKSIVCVTATPMRDLGETIVAVTPDSATGRALLDVICRRSYGFAVRYREDGDPIAAYRHGGACLLIGDAAIDASLALPAEHVHDLGLLWHDMTGADMVYAVLAARAEWALENQADLALAIEALNDSLEWGTCHMADVVAQAQRTHPRPQGFYESYYRTLNYDFDQRAMDGLTMFMNIAAATGVLDEVASVEFVTQKKVIDHA